MTNVLGLPLETAVARLEAEGYSVEAVEARSLKGVQDGDSKRVIRQLAAPDREGTVRLVWARFRTAAEPVS